MSALQQALLGVPIVSGTTYATWNPADKGAFITLSGGNLVATNSNTSLVRSTIGKSSGKWYWEFVGSGGGFVNLFPGIANSSESTSSIVGATANGWMYYQDGNKYTNSVFSAYGSTYSSGNTIGVALDMDAGTVTFYVNNVSQGVAFSGLTGTIYAATSAAGASTAVTSANFGASALTYSPPGGFNAGLYN